VARLTADPLSIETLTELVAAGAAAGAGAAHLADVLDGARAIADAGLDVAIGSGEAEADDHGATSLELKLPFKTRLVKPFLSAYGPRARDLPAGPAAPRDLDDL
jgi:hypothetical protein